MELRSVEVVGSAGPIVGVIEVTPKAVTGWRCCVLCPWQSSHKECLSAKDAAEATAVFIAEQSEHIRLRHPEMLEQVAREAEEEAAVAFGPQPAFVS